MISYVSSVLQEAFSMARKTWRRRYLFRVATLLIFALAFLAILGPYIAPYPRQGMGIEIDRARAFKPPSLEHFLGTDSLGRDVLSRILFALNRALASCVFVVVLSLVIGLFLGSFAAISSKPVEAIVSYLTELLLALPSVLLSALLAILFGGTYEAVLIALIVTWFPWYARIAYVQARGLRELDFVKIPMYYGLSKWYIVTKHIAPNIVAPMIIEALSDIGSVALEISAITFLFGIGIKSIEEPDLGVMIAYSLRDVTTAPWTFLAPASILALIAISFTLFGEVIYEEYHPVLRKRWWLWF
ncbi:ABC transporter permease [Ignisphaera sp. 4213-co]|uniref:ABC transporter permease n=1 Tax=Ignisphaera cupida TaxID=3050454 RepID=A0ABD4Z897_9CREN|nr:ABC transporter permease [Ignisphaera sp. 4213-co]MDK6028788.1 ABC transporter permease [Ignisphaera sp. 4213-co]